MQKPEELKNMLLAEHPENNESRSLFQTVIVTQRSAVTPDGTNHQVLTALRCYPLQAALWRLHPIRFVSRLICVALVVCYYLLLKRRLKAPLQQIIHRGQQNMLELKFPYRPKWKEPYLLEDIYIAAQQELQQLRQENQQLKTALDYAENAELNRRQMVSNITHELKTPLAVIHSYCEGLLSGIAPQKQEKYLNVIMEEADRMDAMVLEMLDLSRLEAGKVRLAQDEVELLGLTQRVLDKLQPLAEAKGLAVVFAIGEVSHLTADEGRLTQVITNLISNAIKYSPVGGQVVLKVFRRNGFVHFNIENEGQPLSEEALEKVWESFYRTEQSRTSEGTGLGLSICKAIIELHRGTCRAKNTSTGVEFGFVLPL
jgi:signal transduction histidine kinase